MERWRRTEGDAPNARLTMVRRPAIFRASATCAPR
jgi:hypothetical protein